MPRVRGDKDYLVPIKGLNTEANPLNFPEQSAADLLNVQMDYDPLRIKVRKGLAAEAAGTTGSISEGGAPLTSTAAYQVYRWDNVNNDADVSFIVVQVGNKLYFNDATAADVSGARQTFIVNLDDLKSGTTEGTLAIATATRVQFQNVKGRLMVVSRAIDPTLISYDPSVPTVQTNKLSLKIRDSLGIDDGLGVDERPSTLSENHEYNLYNQGWYQQRRKTSAGSYVDPVSEFNTVNSEYPSNADIVWVGMVESSGDLIFDAEWLKDQTFGSSPAPRGHYIVDAFNIDRETYRSSPTTTTGSVGGSTGSTGAGGAGGVVKTPGDTEPL